MIKTALKHFIYEICIDKLFDNITHNFSPMPIKYNAGQYIDKLGIYSFDHYTEYFCLSVISTTQTNMLCKYSSYMHLGHPDEGNLDSIDTIPMLEVTGENDRVIINYDQIRSSDGR